MVTFVNKLTINGDVEEFFRIKDSLTEFMSAQPGYRSSSMLRHVGRPEVFIELAEWDDAASHQAAVRSEEFQKRVKGLAGLASVEPGLYEAVAESGVGSV
ncbi:MULTISPECIES: antibiotic biosynthesis monooxygenase [unclassified Streptomyces]|uniref:antibiotic biosynthesis monooxygenase family protein n=1 Tax=unclassified Streptomyces TaxID=2593676 RepID=UPI000690522E|nr:antibiotic biosynthesis monooxygenase family protein [Streptomyces sp. NRRL F-5727]